MKKTLAFALVCLVLLPCVALADVDLTEMNFTQLINLEKQLQREIMSRPEWKEVTVPQGFWTVGVDIPAGTYTITRANKSLNVFLWKKSTGDYSAGGLIMSAVLNDSNPTIGKVALKNGNILETTGPVIVTPYKGLGF